VCECTLHLVTPDPLAISWFEFVSPSVGDTTSHSIVARSNASLDASTMFSFFSVVAVHYTHLRNVFRDVRTLGTFRTSPSPFRLYFRTSTDILLSAPEDCCRMAFATDGLMSSVSNVKGLTSPHASSWPLRATVHRCGSLPVAESVFKVRQSGSRNRHSC